MKSWLMCVLRLYVLEPESIDNSFITRKINKAFISNRELETRPVLKTLLLRSYFEMIVIVDKIGTGSECDPIRPDTTAFDWQVVEERDTKFVIEILDDNTN